MVFADGVDANLSAKVPLPLIDHRRERITSIINLGDVYTEGKDGRTVGKTNK